MTGPIDKTGGRAVILPEIRHSPTEEIFPEKESCIFELEAQHR